MTNYSIISDAFINFDEEIDPEVEAMFDKFERDLQDMDTRGARALAEEAEAAETASANAALDKLARDELGTSEPWCDPDELTDEEAQNIDRYIAADEDRAAAYAAQSGEATPIAPGIPNWAAIRRAQQSEKALRRKRERQRRQVAERRAKERATRNAPGIMTAPLNAAIIAGAHDRFAALCAETSKVPASKKLMHLRGRERDLVEWWIVLSALKVLRPGQKISQADLAEARTGGDAKRTGKEWTKRQAQTALTRIADLEALGVWPA